MITFSRSASLATAALLTTAFISGCTSSSPRYASSTPMQPPEQLQPIASSQVQTESLPPLNGSDGQITTADANANINSSGGFDANGTGQAQNPDGSFVSLNDVGALPSSGGRDISGGVTVTKLLGVWTVIAGSQQCRLNLTQTAKSGTNRYRASTPNCGIPTLALVTSWQLSGSSVQLYDESGSIVGSLLPSGNRFIGTLSGGIAVSMVG